MGKVTFDSLIKKNIKKRNLIFNKLVSSSSILKYIHYFISYIFISWNDLLLIRIIIPIDNFLNELK